MLSSASESTSERRMDGPNASESRKKVAKDALIPTKVSAAISPVLSLEGLEADDLLATLPDSIVCRRLRTLVRTETLDPDATLAVLEGTIQSLNFFRHVALPTLSLPEYLGDAAEKLSGVIRLLKEPNQTLASNKRGWMELLAKIDYHQKSHNVNLLRMSRLTELPDIGSPLLFPVMEYVIALDRLLLKAMDESRLGCIGDPPKSRWIRLQILSAQLRDRVSEREKIEECHQELLDILDSFNFEKWSTYVRSLHEKKVDSDLQPPVPFRAPWVTLGLCLSVLIYVFVSIMNSPHAVA